MSIRVLLMVFAVAVIAFAAAAPVSAQGKGKGKGQGQGQGQGAAMTYYVRTSGDDTNNGLTPQAAFRTIQRAVNATTGGDTTIHVGPGSYFEQVNIGVSDGAGAASGSQSNPNRLIGDHSGFTTGDPAGPVVLDGEGIRPYGVRLVDRDHWEVRGFTIQGQGDYGIAASETRGVSIIGCTVHAPAQIAIFVDKGRDTTIEANTVVRTATSGHIISAHENGGGTLRISRNRFSLTGPLYLSTPFSAGAGSKDIVGIKVHSQGAPPPAVYIENNVGSDCSQGISVTSTHAGSDLIITSNTMVGCSTGIYFKAAGNKQHITNNIIANSQAGLVADAHKPTIKGLLLYNVQWSQYETNKQQGIIVGENPLFVNPSGGDFSVAKGSPAINAGFSDKNAPGVDIMGLPRPLDGLGEGKPVHDLGAYEHDPSAASQSVKRRIVEWSEVSPD